MDRDWRQMGRLTPHYLRCWQKGLSPHLWGFRNLSVEKCARCYTWVQRLIDGSGLFCRYLCRFLCCFSFGHLGQRFATGAWPNFTFGLHVSTISTNVHSFLEYRILPRRFLAPETQFCRSLSAAYKETSASAGSSASATCQRWWSVSEHDPVQVMLLELNSYTDLWVLGFGTNQFWGILPWYTEFSQF